MNSKVIKILGVLIAIGSAGFSVASSFLEDKKLDMKINEKVAEAVAKATKGES